MTARNVSYNGTIAPNASVDVGFQATHTGNTGRAGLVHAQRHRLHGRLIRPSGTGVRAPPVPDVLPDHRDSHHPQ